MKMKMILAAVLAGWAVSFAGAAEPAAKPEKAGTPKIAVDFSSFKTADELWARVEELKQGPSEQPKSQEEAMAFLQSVDATAGEFVNRYPKDARRWDAKLLQSMVVETMATMTGKLSDVAGREVLLKEIGAAADAPAKIKTEARLFLIQTHAQELGPNGSAEQRTALDAEIAAFQKDFPDDPRVGPMQMFRVELQEKSDPAKATAMLKELAAGKDAKVAAEAKRRLDLIDLKNKPLELKFTSVEGKDFDMAKLHGKVVLVDFWATWCGPCVREVPHVVEAYKKLHEKGFEIVGISFDKDKEKLLKFTKDKEMSWVQYFDGKGWQNDIGAKFGIQEVPTMWLLDKTGKIRSTEARADLESEVAKLLAE